jgi:hypothetical protein
MHYFDTPPISQKQLEGATLHSDRFEYIKHLPVGMRIAEIGVAAGDYSYYVAKDTNAISVDLFDLFDHDDFYFKEYGKQRFTKETHYNFVKERFKDFNNVKLHKGKSEHTFANVNKKFDYIYLDAIHLFAPALLDLENANKCLDQGGIIGINDFNMYPNPNYDKEGDKLEIVQAVSEFLKMHQEFKVKAFAFNTNLTSDIYLIKL